MITFNIINDVHINGWLYNLSYIYTNGIVNITVRPQDWQLWYEEYMSRMCKTSDYLIINGDLVDNVVGNGIDPGDSDNWQKIIDKIPAEKTVYSLGNHELVNNNDGYLVFNYIVDHFNLGWTPSTIDTVHTRTIETPNEKIQIIMPWFGYFDNPEITYSSKENVKNAIAAAKKPGYSHIIVQHYNIFQNGSADERDYLAFLYEEFGDDVVVLTGHDHHALGLWIDSQYPVKNIMGRHGGGTGPYGSGDGGGWYSGNYPAKDQKWALIYGYTYLEVSGTHFTFHDRDWAGNDIFTYDFTIRHL